MKKFSMLLVIILLPGLIRSQIVYEGINNTGIYEFLDELANLKMISLNSVIKPYSRKYISQKLFEALARQDELNNRQKKELIFYLQNYQLERPEIPVVYDHALNFMFKKQLNLKIALNPLAFQYKDSLFTLSLQPSLGFMYTTNENGSEYHRSWGGKLFGYIGKNFGFYGSLQDNNERIAFTRPEYFTLRQGAVYKQNPNGGVDYFEMRGGIVASWNWGSFGILNDRPEWGNNYHGANILSGKAPPFPYIYLHIHPVKWFDFHYIHGWLNSGVVDSSRSYAVGDKSRIIYVNKYIATNMFTFIPFRRLNLSFGNSIIYSDINVHPAYLIPFMFFNAVDANRTGYDDNASSNSQLFFDISSRQIKYLHLWVTLFIDELKVSRIFDPDLLNWTSRKAGFRLSDFPLQNLSLTTEWTKTNPITYKHYFPSTSFTSNNYCLGHYLRDNSMEIYVALNYKPLRGLHVKLAYTYGVHGDEYVDDRSYDYSKLRFLDNIIWQENTISCRAQYEYVSNGFLFIEYMNSQRKGDVGYQPAFMHGSTNTFLFGATLGL
ncbi:MAG: hypothetical protein HQ542_04900 [Bacteroidia bacterium]|nr:hypothetical protein [Bacteroidia bacterium]